ncbi:hypothetical protein [Gemmatimonas sp.]|uniref:hypothetical protein n=1 Tax=Gemmatimonas sp. TaxID=1962908 RepID=UPI00286A2F52|nr:hypothetical protein [Gemmatimonas sp.]
MWAQESPPAGRITLAGGGLLITAAVVVIGLYAVRLFGLWPRLGTWLAHAPGRFVLVATTFAIGVFVLGVWRLSKAAASPLPPRALDESTAAQTRLRVHRALAIWASAVLLGAYLMGVAEAALPVVQYDWLVTVPGSVQDKQQLQVMRRYGDLLVTRVRDGSANTTIVLLPSGDAARRWEFGVPR